MYNIVMRILGIPFFADERDAKHVMDWFHRQKDVAFLLPNGPNRWKAVSRVTHLEDGEYVLWHIPGGPLAEYKTNRELVKVPDPWKRWSPLIPSPDPASLDPDVPYPGVPYDVPNVEAPGLFGLELWTRHRRYSQQEKERLKVIHSLWDGPNDVLQMSALSWKGQHWFHGKGPAATLQFWNRFQQWLAREAIPLADIPCDSRASEPWRIYSLPSALRRLKEGQAYHANGFPLDKEIRAAKLPTSKR